LKLGIGQLISCLGIKKQNGIPIIQSVLVVIFLAIVGKKRVSKGEILKDYGIAAIAGFSKMPSKSYLHKFLDQITVSCAENFQIFSAKAFDKLGIFKGKIINLDGHFIAYFGKSKIGKDKHPTRNISMNGIKTLFAQDQETGNPVFASVAYPRKGLTPENVTIPMLEIVKDILPGIEKVVFDKWFSVGSLLEYLDKKMGLKYVTLIKLYENRIEEMKSMPKEKFKPLIGTDRQIAFKDTNLRNYSGNMKLIVVSFLEDGVEKYYGYLTNDYVSTEEQILDQQSWRWRIENFFKNCNFLGFDALPSVELNKIAALLSMKVLSFNLIACLRKDLGEDFEKMTVESIFEQIIEFPALVQAKGDKIIITFYGNYKNSHKAAVQKLMKKFDETGMNAPISWLGNRRIEIRFK
jgi:hypothetical protein